MHIDSKDDFTMPGSRIRDGHASTVLSIVGKDRMLPVTSSGTRFYMRGSFAWRTVAQQVGQGTLDPVVIQTKTVQESRGASAAAAINIAQCDDNVSRRTYMALIGGACHEAFHRVYSYQGTLTAIRIQEAIRPAVLNPQVDWTKRSGLVMELQNIIEDIFIERLGCAEFPGVRTKLADLADFIVKMEAEGRAAAKVKSNTVQTAFTIFRDVGLGYSTPLVRANLVAVRQDSPAGAAMLAPGGVLYPILLKSIPDVSSDTAILSAKVALNNGISLRLALEAVALLDAASVASPQPSRGDMDGDQPGTGQGGKPSPNGKPSKGDKPSKGSKSSEKGDKPSKGSKSSEKGDKPSKGGEGSKEGDPSEDQPSDGQGESGEAPSGEDPGNSSGGDGAGEGDPSDAAGEGAGGGTGEGSGEGSGEGDSSSQSTGSLNPGTNTLDGEGNGGGAGGGEGTNKTTAGDFLDQYDASGSGALDSNSALEQGVKNENQAAVVAGGSDTRPYRPFTTSQDEVRIVSPNAKNTASYTSIVAKVRKGTTYLKTRLATVFRALENSGTEHGIRKAARVSDRMLVNTFCELRSGVSPSRAYMERSPQIDMSVAAAMVIDESSSMSNKLTGTCAVAYTLGDALDGIGAKTLTVGFRSKHAAIDYEEMADSSGCHRYDAITYDIFKGWGDTFKQAAPRFREIMASGGTPMSDGVEFALNELSNRPEGHRVLFVLTDGQPDTNHAPVMRGQFQRATEAGILVIGVGLGHGSEYVRTAFPDHVYAEKIDDLPKLLVKKMEELVRTRHAAAKRGRTVRAA